MNQNGFRDNYLQRFVDITKGIVDTPTEFLQGAGLMLISTTIGSFYYVMGGRDAYLNMFIVLCSSPGIGRRGAVDKLFNITLKSALSEYTILCNKDVKEDYKNNIKATSLEGGSPQGLVDNIEELKEDGIRSFLLDSPEFGAILEGIANKNTYMMGFNHLLCRLWSREGTYESFSKKGKTGDRMLQEGTYFSILGYMQKAKYYLNENMSNVGLLRRLLIIDIKGENMNRHLPAILDGNGMKFFDAKNNLKALGKEIGTRMYELKQLCDKDKERYLRTNTDILGLYQGNVNIMLNKDVIKLVNKIEKEDVLMARQNDDDPFLLYKQSRWEYVLKIACCIAIAKKKVLVGMEDVEYAEKLIKKLTIAIEPTIRNILISIPRKKHMEDLDVIYKYIKKHPKIKEGDLNGALRYTGITPMQRALQLQELVASNRIVGKDVINSNNKTVLWSVK